MKKKHPPQNYVDKVILAEQFAEKHSILNRAIRVNYTSEWDCFEVFGHTNLEKDGQYSTKSRPVKVFVWVDNDGHCSLTAPPKYPWGENPNDV